MNYKTAVTYSNFNQCGETVMLHDNIGHGTCEIINCKCCRGGSAADCAVLTTEGVPYMFTCTCGIAYVKPNGFEFLVPVYDFTRKTKI